MQIAPLSLLLACGGTGLLGKSDISAGGYCGLATADSTTWPDNLSLTAGDGVVAVQATVEQGELHADSNGAWLLKLFPYPDAQFDSGFVFDAEFDPEKDVRDETDEEGVRTVTLKTVIPFEYKGDEYEKAATFVLVSADEGTTVRLTMKDSPIITGQFGIDLVVAKLPLDDTGEPPEEVPSDTGEDTAVAPPPPSLLEVCEVQLG